MYIPVCLSVCLFVYLVSRACAGEETLEEEEGQEVVKGDRLIVITACKLFIVAVRSHTRYVCVKVFGRERAHVWRQELKAPQAADGNRSSGPFKK